jgi:hypothetical protein
LELQNTSNLLLTKIMQMGKCITEGVFRQVGVHYRLAADQNDRVGQYCYGKCLLEGRGVRVDLVGGAKYYKLSADQNHSPVQVHYGRMLSEGSIGPADLTGAAKYFKRSADQNNPAGQFLYDECLLGGRGLPKDLTAAAKVLPNKKDASLLASQPGSLFMTHPTWNRLRNSFNAHARGSQRKRRSLDDLPDCHREMAP